MKSSRIIGFDLDGTILDHTKNKIELAKEFGVTLTPEQTVSGKYRQVFPGNMDEEFSTRLFTDPSTGKYTSIEPCALEVLGKIKSSGQPYYLISRRKTEIVVPLLERLKLWPQVFDAKNTYFVDLMSDKVEPCRKLGITDYVDDHVKSLTQTLSFIPHRYLFDPYNVWPDSADYNRVSNWEEIGRALLD